MGIGGEYCGEFITFSLISFQIYKFAAAPVGET